MKLAPVLISSVLLAGAAMAADSELVDVYCFSDDLEAGFKDETAAYFCKQLGGHGEKKQTLRVVPSADDTHAQIHFLGQERFTEPGEATYLTGGYVWTPDQLKDGARALIVIGDFQKGFYGEGLNDSALVVLWKQIEEWIRENRETILEKAEQK